MAQLGSGQGTSYSAAIDTHQTWRNALAASPDSDTRLDSEAFNDFAQAIVRIQTALGAKPEGVFGSLAARLNQFLPGAGASPSYVPFNNALQVTIPGLVHRLGTDTILYQVYDDGIPATAINPNDFTVQVDPATYDITLSFTQQQSGYVVLSAAAPLYTTTFTDVTSLNVPGTAHQLSTAALFYAIYDAGNPRSAVRPNTLTIHPSTFDVAMTFVQPQSGSLLLSAVGPRYQTTCTNQTAITISGGTHGLGTQAVLYQVYDNAIPASPVRPNSVTVHPTSYAVTVTFSASQTGSIILAASQGSSGNEFEVRDAGIVNSTAVRMRSQSGNLFLQMGVGHHLVILDQFGQAVFDFLADLSASQYGLGIGMSPTFKLHLAADSAAKPGSNTWTIASDERLKTAVEPFTDGLALVQQLDPVSFEYNGLGGMPADGTRQAGFLAQALQAIAPYLVRSYRGQLAENEAETDILTYEGHALSFILVNAIKELAGARDALQDRCALLEDAALSLVSTVNDLGRTCAALDARCAALEASIATLTPPAPEEPAV